MSETHSSRSSYTSKEAPEIEDRIKDNVSAGDLNYQWLNHIQKGLPIHSAVYYSQQRIVPPRTQLRDQIPVDKSSDVSII